MKRPERSDACLIPISISRMGRTSAASTSIGSGVSSAIPFLGSIHKQPIQMPFDVLAIVLSFLNSPKDLCNLACASRSMRIEAERILYSSLSTNNATTLEGFLSSIISRPERGDYVKSLFLVFPARDIHLRRQNEPAGRVFSLSSLRSRLEDFYYAHFTWDDGLLSRALALCSNLVQLNLKLPEGDYSLRNAEIVPDRTPHSIPSSLLYYLQSTEKGPYYSSSLHPLTLHAPSDAPETPVPQLTKITGDPEVVEALTPFRPLKDITLMCLNNDPCGVASALRTLARSSGPVECLYMDARVDGSFHLSFLRGLGSILPSLRVLRISMAALVKGENGETVIHDIEEGLKSFSNLELFEIIQVDLCHPATAEVWLYVAREWELRKVGKEWILQVPELGVLGVLQCRRNHLVVDSDT